MKMNINKNATLKAYTLLLELLILALIFSLGYLIGVNSIIS